MIARLACLIFGHRPVWMWRRIGHTEVQVVECKRCGKLLWS